MPYGHVLRLSDRLGLSDCQNEQCLLVGAVQITVDGDTSTNDTVIGLASGAAGNQIIKDASSPEAAQLEAAVTALLQVVTFSHGIPSNSLSCRVKLQWAHLDVHHNRCVTI
jgi:hypothetical protein